MADNTKPIEFTQGAQGLNLNQPIAYHTHNGIDAPQINFRDILSSPVAEGSHSDGAGNVWWGANTYTLANAKIDKDGNATFNSLTLTGGTFKYGKTSFTDSTNAGYYLGNEGLYVGSASDATKLKYTLATGALDFVGNVSGRSSATLASAIDASGHFADNAISTATPSILGAFTFGVSGALQIGTYVNGVSGDIRISPTGILGRDSAGATTFSINGTTGVAVLNGLVVGTNVGLGTAQTASQVTTIVGNTVTTSFVNALSVTAGSVAAENITGTTITGKTLQTASSGQRIILSQATNDLNFYITGNDSVCNIGTANSTILWVSPRSSAITAARFLNLSTQAMTGSDPLVLMQTQNASSTIVNLGLGNYGSGQVLSLYAFGTGAQLNLGSYGTTPTTLVAGDLWRETDALKFRNSLGTQTVNLSTPFTNTIEKTVPCYSSTITISTTNTPENPSVWCTQGTTTAYAVWHQSTGSKLSFSKSTDSGATWAAATEDITGAVNANRNDTDRAVWSYYHSTQFVSVVYPADDGKVYELFSSNGGTTWGAATEIDTGGVVAVSGIDENTRVFAYYYDTTTIKFKRGNNIYTVASGFNAPDARWISMYALNTNYIYIACHQKISETNRLVCYYSADGGVNWNGMSSSQYGGVNSCSIWAVSSTEIWATSRSTGSGAALFKSTDGNLMGFDQLFTTNFIYSSIYVGESGKIRVFGSGATREICIAVSDDSGVTFKYQTLTGADTGSTISMCGFSKNALVVAKGRDTDLWALYTTEGKLFSCTSLTLTPLKPNTNESYLYSRVGELYGMDASGNEKLITS